MGLNFTLVITLLSYTVIILGIVWFLIEMKQYKASAYFQVTGYSYFSMRFDLGRYGEYLTYRYLRSYESQGAKFLFNCYLPRNNGDTTEIDVLMIYKSGLYVFESKNYSGWIFGSENQKTWTQTLPQGGKSHKEHFFNPIMQNNLHIKWLKHLLQDETIPIHSIIVFSERCTLKSVTVSSPNVEVIRRKQVLKTVTQTDSQNTPMLTQDRIQEIYDRLYPYSQVSVDVKQAHIDSIHNRNQHSRSKSDTTSDESHIEENAEIVPEGEADMKCPRCGAPLVLRVAKKGQHAGNRFYGCSTYPKCRYKKNI